MIGSSTGQSLNTTPGDDVPEAETENQTGSDVEVKPEINDHVVNNENTECSITAMPNSPESVKIDAIENEVCCI